MSEALTQTEFDLLWNLPKQTTEDRILDYPDIGQSLTFEVVAQRERFMIDINRRNSSMKLTLQERYRKEIVMARLDFGSKPHRNPDDSFVSGNHLHMYREGFADNFAIELPERFNGLEGHRLFFEFMRFCNIIEPYSFIRTRLFQ